MSREWDVRRGAVVVGFMAAVTGAAPAGATKEVTITPNSVQTVPFALLDETAYVIVGYAQGCKILTGRVDVDEGLMDWDDAVSPAGDSVTFQGSPVGGFAGAVDRLWMYAKLAGELSVEGEEEPGEPPTYTINTAKTALWIEDYTIKLILDTWKGLHHEGNGGCNPAGMMGYFTVGPRTRRSDVSLHEESGDWKYFVVKKADVDLTWLGNKATLHVSFEPHAKYYHLERAARDGIVD